jgi:hypothetical protein
VTTPGGILNIGATAGRNHFKLQYAPDPPSSTVVEVTQADIESGANFSPYFTVVGGVARFQVRVDAATTSGSSYPRSELREVAADGSDTFAWDTAAGPHWLWLRGRVTHVPPVKPTVIVAQIHNGTDDQIAICTQLSSGVLKMLCRVNGTSSGQPNLANPYVVGTTYEILVKVHAGVTTIWYNDMVTPVITTTAVTGATSYFKAGCYPNSNENDETDDTEYGQTEIDWIEVWHAGTASPFDPADPNSQPSTIVEDFEDTTYNVAPSGTWARSNTSANGGTWSLRSAAIGHGATTDATVTVPSGATSVRFWYRVSSESGFDYFRFLIAGAQQFQASGNGVWTQSASYAVTPGQVLTFRYIKDGSTVANLDAAFIDDLVFTVPAPTNHPGAFLAA